HRAVDVAAGGVLLEPGPVVVGADDDEEQLAPALGRRDLRPAQDTGEERVAEELLTGLGDDEGQGVAAARGEGARRLPGDVVELRSGGAHGLTGALTHPRVSGEHPAGRRAGHPGALRDR